MTQVFVCILLVFVLLCNSVCFSSCDIPVDCDFCILFVFTVFFCVCAYVLFMLKLLNVVPGFRLILMFICKTHGNRNKFGDFKFKFQTQMNAASPTPYSTPLFPSTTARLRPQPLSWRPASAPSSHRLNGSSR